MEQGKMKTEPIVPDQQSIEKVERSHRNKSDAEKYRLAQADTLLHDYFSKMGKKSAKARMKKLSPEDRKRIASEAAKARWAKKPEAR